MKHLNTNRPLTMNAGLALCASAAFAAFCAPSYAGTSMLGGNAVLDQATRAEIAANGENAAAFSSSSATAVLDWSKFNIGGNQSMTFNGTGTTFFNLVSSAAGKSQIDGIINGNGSVWVINPSGIAFGAGAMVDVGGVFAAAAGNISNADALRDGTASLPEFSGFGGEISSSADASFTADQVVLLGKSVNAAGNFSSAKLDIGAGGLMTVDEVAGGRVSVNVAALADDPSEIGLRFGDLFVADSDGYSGELMAKSDRGIDVGEGSRVMAFEGISLLTAEGDITVGSGAVVKGYGDVTVHAAVSEGKQGNVTIDGTVGNFDGYFGSTSVVAGRGEGSSGNVVLNGTVSGDCYAEVATRTGDVEINGELRSNVMASASTHDGSILVNEGGSVSSTGAYADYGSLYAGQVGMLAAMDSGSTGDVIVNGTVSAQGEGGAVFLSSGRAEDGSLSGGDGYVVVRGDVEADSSVTLLSASAGIGIVSGSSLTAGDAVSAVAFGGVSGGGTINVEGGSLSVNSGIGSIALNGKIKAGEVNLVADDYATYGYAGDISLGNAANELSGSISASGMNVSIANGGDTKLGNIIAAEDFTVVAGGSIIQSSDSAVIAPQGTTTLKANGDIAMDSSANNFGVVEAEGNNITLADRNSIALGDIVAGGNLTINSGNLVYQRDGTSITANSEGALTKVTAVNGVNLGSDGNDFSRVSVASKDVIIIDENGVRLGDMIATDGSVSVRTKTGDMVVEEGSVVESRSESGRVYLIAGAENGSTGNLIVDGRVSADAANGGVYLFSAAGDGASGGVSINGNVSASGNDGVVTVRSGYGTGSAGDIVVDGSVASSGIVSLESGFGTAATGSVEVNGSVTGASVKMLTESGDVTVAEGATVTANAGNVQLVTAMTDGANGDILVAGTVEASGKIAMQSGYGAGSSGDIEVSGTVRTTSSNGSVYITSGYGNGSSGDVKIGGTVEAQDYAQIRAMNGSVTVEADGTVAGARTGETAVRIDTIDSAGAGGDITIAGRIVADNGNISVISETETQSSDGTVTDSSSGKGDVTVSGTLAAGGKVFVEAGHCQGTSGDVSVSGDVSGQSQVILVASDGDVAVAKGGSVRSSGADGNVYLATGVYGGTSGDIAIDGRVTAGQDVFLLTGVSDSGPASGSVHFGVGGNASAGSSVYASIHGGNLTQSGAQVGASSDGYAESAALPAAMSAETVNISVKGGSVGNGAHGYVAVSGKVYADAEGDISIAAANGENLKGGSGAGSVSGGDYGTFTFGDPNGDSNMRAGGNLSVYTAGEIESSGLLQAGGNLTVSAAKFGDMSYLRAGGTLTVNNVGKPGHPRIAYFESVDGKEPKIANLPNDTVIFIDGRLAGGNLGILNKFGANEAFLVATPELKSTQGIFGDPPFLHSDLDVANPLEVNAIDYMIQEIPRLTLSSDFPAQVDRNVEANGLSERDVIRFGL